MAILTGQIFPMHKGVRDMNQYEQGFEDGWRAACEAVKALLDKPMLESGDIPDNYDEIDILVLQWICPVDDESDDEEDICRLPIG